MVLSDDMYRVFEGNLGRLTSNFILSKNVFFPACTANNNIKIFTSNLEDEGAITGLNTNANTKKIFWHQDSSCLVMIGSTKHHLQFYDPIERKQKFALEIISQNVILGEREGK